MVERLGDLSKVLGRALEAADDKLQPHPGQSCLSIESQSTTYRVGLYQARDLVRVRRISEGDGASGIHFVAHEHDRDLFVLGDEFEPAVQALERLGPRQVVH